MEKPAIWLKGVSKKYHIYDTPLQRLKGLLPWNRGKSFGREHIALHEIDLEIKKGEVVGIVGRNGAGKSTLLQIICGTLTPSSGEVVVNGRVAALLELGSGFNPEFSGRENVYLAAAIAGMDRAEIEAKYDDIVAFSEIGEYIEQPVKSYSSGMMVRLAFSVATSIDPDILIIDEALSVGDGAFARKSFDRIMGLKEKGVTILFCSHNLYQIEALCKKAIWLDKSRVVEFGESERVVLKYQKFLDDIDTPRHPDSFGKGKEVSMGGTARFEMIKVCADGKSGSELELVSEVSELSVDISFTSDPVAAAPVVAVVITDERMRNISSCITLYDGIEVNRDENGKGRIRVKFDKIGLLRGKYYLHALLMCEKAIHIYSNVQCATLNVKRNGLEVGVVALRRTWEQ